MICPPSSGSQYPLAPVLGGRAEDAFRLSMIGARGDLRMFRSNGLVGTIHDAGPGPAALADDRQRVRQDEGIGRHQKAGGMIDCSHRPMVYRPDRILVRGHWQTLSKQSRLRPPTADSRGA